MNAQYEKPVIAKVQTGITDKHGSSPAFQTGIANTLGSSPASARTPRTAIDGIGIDELVAEYGSPLFVFSEITVRRKYREIYTAFSTRYPHVTFGWSYKTNYLPAICAILHQEGAIAEVVSDMEYEKARRLGVSGRDIIFNGPHKSKKSLKRAIVEGAMIHIDHFDELQDIEQIADELGRPAQVGLRVNLDADIQPQWSRFGFNLESGQAMEAVSRMAQNGKVILTGLHCHLGTYIVEPKAYAVQVEKLVQFGYQVEERFGFNMNYFDIGGGLPSQNELKSAYHSSDLLISSIDEYAEQVTTALYLNLRPGDFPQLILESGRAIVDDAGYLISSIVASKRLADGRKAYVADAGVNLLFTAFWYTQKLEFDREITGMQEPSVIYGPMCMNIDVLNESTMLPPLDRGTRIILSPVGAYNVTQWMQFIEYRPHVALIGEDGSVDIIREAEDYSDIARRERLPERLRLPVSDQTNAERPAESIPYERPADGFFQNAPAWGKWSSHSDTMTNVR